MKDKCMTWTKPGLALGLAVVLLLGGCAINRNFQPEVYKVRAGDSLSAIARHYGLNWHDLARWNNIQAPYIIRVGQRISLDPFPPLDYDNMRSQRQQARVTRRPTPRSTVTAMDEDRSFTVSGLSGQQAEPQQPGQQRQPNTAQNAAQNAAQDDYGPIISAADDTGAATTPGAAAAAAGSTTTAATTAPPLVNAAGWRWPLATAILEAHAVESARHGLNLYGVAGAPVYAARNGQVVYSGAGLQGIGQLVIIKHADEYLSAYGYVRNVQVSEGDRITAGQHVADMGVGPGSRAELHFEIRHQGEPIDPQSVLPKL